MAKWNKNKVSSDLINNGNEFTSGDNLAVNELNAIVNNSFYASEKAENAEKLAESAVKGNGTLVTINEQIQGEWSADFAEAERQKSKNLSPSLITGAYVFANGSYTNIEDFVTTPIKIPVKPNTTYVASFNLDNFTINGSTGFIFYDINGNYIGYKANVLTWTTPTNCYYTTFNIYKTGIVLSNVSDFMIEEGSVATDYQEYNGAILHEKDIADVEHTTVIYDKNDTSKNVINGTAYTNGLYISGINIGDNYETIPADAKRLRIYYCSYFESNTRTGGNANVVEMDILNYKTEWKETCVENCYRNEINSVTTKQFKMCIAVNDKYMNVKFFSDLNLITDGSSYIYKLEVIK